MDRLDEISAQAGEPDRGRFVDYLVNRIVNENELIVRVTPPRSMQPFFDRSGMPMVQRVPPPSYSKHARDHSAFNRESP